MERRYLIRRRGCVSKGMPCAVSALVVHLVYDRTVQKVGRERDVFFKASHGPRHAFVHILSLRYMFLFWGSSFAVSMRGGEGRWGGEKFL